MLRPYPSQLKQRIHSRTPRRNFYVALRPNRLSKAEGYIRRDLEACPPVPSIGMRTLTRQPLICDFVLMATVWARVALAVVKQYGCISAAQNPTWVIIRAANPIMNGSRCLWARSGAGVDNVADPLPAMRAISLTCCPRRRLTAFFLLLSRSLAQDPHRTRRFGRLKHLEPAVRCSSPGAHFPCRDGY